MSGKPGSRGCDQVLSEYLETRSEARGVRNGLRGMIHCRGRSPEEQERERDQRGWGVWLGVGWAWSGVEMRVAAPFFTADKNICWDINLKVQSSLPLLPCHPSSFRANHHLGTPPHLYAAPHPHTCTLKQPYPPSTNRTHFSTLSANSGSCTNHACRSLGCIYAQYT